MFEQLLISFKTGFIEGWKTFKLINRHPLGWRRKR